MATLALSSIGNAVGGPVGGLIGNYIGHYLDSDFFKSSAIVEKNKIGSFGFQTNTYERKIPIVFGTMRVFGNIIWAAPIKKIASMPDLDLRQDNPKTSSVIVRYDYYITVAIAICEGEIDGIERMWVDDVAFDLNNSSITVYKGSEDQTPNNLMYSFDPRTPAYRGIAYVVIEDFLLTNGNNIPNFSFEIICTKKFISQNSVCNKIKAISIMPGFGEFSYDTMIISLVSTYNYFDKDYRSGYVKKINSNNNSNIADIIVSLDLMQKTFVNLEWVSVSVAWFSDSLDCGICKIYPAVEEKYGVTTLPEQWSVAGFTRKTAGVVLKDANNKPIYCGTPNDGSLLRLLDELKNRNIKVMLYLFIVVNNVNFDRASFITGTAEDVKNFFANNSDYVNFVTHYANITINKIDAISIGSSLFGLTSVFDDRGFPGIDGLINLADKVKKIVGESTLVTYSAGYKEYNGYENKFAIDKLWSSDNINFVSIDAFFPITDFNQYNNIYTVDFIVDQWQSGYGYDYFYSNDSGSLVANKYVDKIAAWKNIDYWWNNLHKDISGAVSDWQPRMKKIWFSAIGFNSASDCAMHLDFEINNKMHSDIGHETDFMAQYTAICGTVKKWDESVIVENMFFWYWDARPYPYFPSLKDVWHDTNNWIVNYAINGKLGILGVADLVHFLFDRANIKAKCDKISNYLYGFVVDDSISISKIISILSTCYGFDVVNKNGDVFCLPKYSANKININSDDFLNQGKNEVIHIVRRGHESVIDEVVLRYFCNTGDYEVDTISVQSNFNKLKNVVHLSIPISIDGGFAKFIANSILKNSLNERNIYKINLPIKYIFLNPSDIITFTIDEKVFELYIIEIKIGFIVKLSCIYYPFFLQRFSATDFLSYNFTSSVIKKFNDIKLYLFDIPNHDGVPGIVAAVCSDLEFIGGVNIYSVNDNGFNDLITHVPSFATFGFTIDRFGDPISFGIIDNINTIKITINNGVINSIGFDELLNGFNMALIGNEIVQFMNATLISESVYMLSGFLRGRFGTENKSYLHKNNEIFLLLDRNTCFFAMGNGLINTKFSVSVIASMDIDGIKKLHSGFIPGFTEIYYKGAALLPYSVVGLKAQYIDLINSVEITWIRRCRINGEMRDFIDVPLDEEYEKYEIDILKDDSVIRTIYVENIQKAYYTKDQQILDFGFEKTSFDFIVYQMSAWVGRGSGSVGSYCK